MDIVKLPKCLYLESSATTGTPFPNPYFTTQEALSRNEQKQGKRILDAGEKRLKKGKKIHSHLLLLRVKIIILCSDDLSPHSGQGTPNTGLGILGKRSKKSTGL